MEFQWYPGHMTKAIRQMREDIKIIDLVIELIDARIPLASRNPDIDTLGQGKARIILLNKTGKISTNDIVVFQPSSNLRAQYSVKRVIGTPGDKIRISGGDVYLNDVLFHNIAETEEIVDPGLAATEIVLGEDEYFLLGDNRNNSEDSRYETIGNISSDAVIGKVWFCVSLRHFGLINY